MTDKKLFEIALKYIEKEYSSSNLKDGDDLYKATTPEIEKCVSYYHQIINEGLNWAYKHLETL